jgi:hypothetical protein
MELSSFSENIVTETFERNGETVELQINIDAIVPDYYEQLEERLKPVTKRLEVLRAKHSEMIAEIAKREKDAKKKGKKSAKPQAPLPSILPLEKELAEIQREAFAERLTCPVRLPDGSLTALLKGWSITENGSPIEPTKANLMRLPPKAVEELWTRSIKRADTVKKRVDEETEETSESTPSGSRGLHAVGQTG